MRQFEIYNPVYIEVGIFIIKHNNVSSNAREAF